MPAVRQGDRTPIWDSCQALTVLLNGLLNCNKLNAPEEADEDPGSG